MVLLLGLLLILLLLLLGLLRLSIYYLFALLLSVFVYYRYWCCCSCVDPIITNGSDAFIVYTVSLLFLQTALRCSCCSSASLSSSLDKLFAFMLVCAIALYSQTRRGSSTPYIWHRWINARRFSRNVSHAVCNPAAPLRAWANRFNSPYMLRES